MLVNAGHVPPLLLRSDQAMPIFASGPPLGLFPTSRYEGKEIRLLGGETLLLCTDGVTEARDLFDSEYGLQRLTSLAAAQGETPMATDSTHNDSLHAPRLFE